MESRVLGRDLAQEQSVALMGTFVGNAGSGIHVARHLAGLLRAWQFGHKAVIWGCFSLTLVLASLCSRPAAYSLYGQRVDGMPFVTSPGPKCEVQDRPRH